MLNRQINYILKGQNYLTRKKSSIFQETRIISSFLSPLFLSLPYFSSLSIFHFIFYFLSLFFLAFPCEWRFPAGTVTDTQKQTLLPELQPCKFPVFGPNPAPSTPRIVSVGCEQGEKNKTGGWDRIRPGETIGALLVRYGAGCWRGKQWGDDNKWCSFSGTGVWRSRKVSAGPGASGS